MKEDNPLVSIIVITYNSAKYVLETLESAKAQTYQNIELIVSDDCSTDNTVEICREWIGANKERFVRTELITIPENTGIPANCNRGVKVAHGEWVKLIAGDDMLMEDAINEVVKFSIYNSSVDIILTIVEVYQDNFKKRNLISTRPNDWQSMDIYNASANSKMQLEYILRGGYHNAPGLFLKRIIFEQIGFLDEQYKLIEDIPLYLKLGLKGKLIKFVPIITVKYRKSVNNLTSTFQKIIPLYILQQYDSIFSASKVFGQRKYILNSYWNKKLISLIFLLGNKGYICYKINQIRIKLQPIRFYNLLNKLKI